MSDFKIRDATFEDVPAINKLFNDAVKEDLLDWDLPQPLDFHEEWFAKMKGYPLLVSENREKQVVAYGALEPQCSADGSSYMFNTNLLIITGLQHRRCAIATDLWQALCDHQLTSERKVFLVICTILSNNLLGTKFAKKMHFDFQGKLDKMAVKNDEFVDRLTFTSFLGASPSVQGQGFPPTDVFALPPTPEGMEVDLDSPNFVIRDATLHDLSFIVQVYNEVIFSSTALEYWLPRTVEQRRSWLQRLIDERYPCLIAESDGQPLGYVSLAPWNDHPDQSYTYSAYISAFVRKDVKRKKVAETLYSALLKHRYLKENRIFTVVAEITAVNGPSLAGALKAGFRQGVTIPRVLVKFGEAYSIIWLQREFGPEPDLRQLAIERSRWHDDIRQIEMH